MSHDLLVESGLLYRQNINLDMKYKLEGFDKRKIFAIVQHQNRFV